MKTKTKVLIGAMVALVIAMPLMSTVLASEPENGVPNQGQGLSPGERLMRLMRSRQAQWQGQIVPRQFFSGAEAVTLDGTVVTSFRNLLVVSSGGKQLNVHLPGVWSLGSEIINVSQLCETYLTSGTSVSIKALQRQVTNEQGVTLTTILAYEITAGDNHFYAVLPFNISTG